MRRLRNFPTLLAAIILSALTPAATQARPMANAFAQSQSPDAAASSASSSRSAGDEKRLSLTRDVMDEFARGDLAAVRGRFSDDMKQSVSESDLRDARDQLFEIAGAFQEQVTQATHLVLGEPIYISRSRCAHFQVELRLMFGDAGEITLFRVGPVSDMPPEAMEAAARDVADQLRRQQFAEVNAKFNVHMKGQMPTDRLEASWGHVMIHLGPFKSFRSARKDPDADRVDVHCEFQNGPMVVRVAFDPAGKVSGLWMLPAEPEKDSQI